MMTIELFMHGTVERKREIAERLQTALLGEADAPDSVLERSGAFFHVLVHEPQVWVTGGDPDQPRYLIRATVPGSWNDKEFSGYLTPIFTDIIASFEDDPTRLRREPHCVVQFVGLREHSVGTLGRPTTSADLTRLMTEGYQHSEDEREVPDGSVIDPTCGMIVELADAEFTLTHEGTTYAFCAPVCRKVFAEDNAIPA